MRRGLDLILEGEKVVNKTYLSMLFCLGFSLNVNMSWADEHATSQALAAFDNVSSVDIKYVNKTVHLLLGKQAEDESHLWYLASDDQGETWSKAINITQGQGLKARMSRGNDARLAVQGDHIVAVWMSHVEGAPHNAGSMVAMASHDAGQTWGAVDSIADWQGSHGFFAMDADDNAMSLAWLDSRTKQGDGATQGLRYSTSVDGGRTWSTNLTLDERSCACCWNTAQYHNGQFYVLYRDKDPSDMTLGAINSEQKWTQLSTVGDFNWDFQGCPHIGGSIAFDDQHQLIHSTVGTGHSDLSGTYYLNSADQGKTWSEPHRLGTQTSVHSDLAAANNGEVIAAWDHITETGFRIDYASSQDQGQSWSKAASVSSSDVRATHPRVIAMVDRFLLVWTEGKEKQTNNFRMTTIPFGQ